jgi:hypothetical protein
MESAVAMGPFQSELKGHFYTGKENILNVEKRHLPENYRREIRALHLREIVFEHICGRAADTHVGLVQVRIHEVFGVKAIALS